MKGSRNILFTYYKHSIKIKSYLNYELVNTVKSIFVCLMIIPPFQIASSYLVLKINKT